MILGILFLLVLGPLSANSEGSIVGTLRTNRPCLVDPFIAEAMALFHAASFCKELGLNQLIVEGDALQVISLLKNQATD